MLKHLHVQCIMLLSKLSYNYNVLKVLIQTYIYLSPCTLARI